MNNGKTIIPLIIEMKYDVQDWKTGRIKACFNETINEADLLLIDLIFTLIWMQNVNI